MRLCRTAPITVAAGLMLGFATMSSAPTQAQAGLSPTFPPFNGVVPTFRPFSTFTPLTTFSVDGEVAEIAAVTPDGNTVLYTDSENQEVGFVDITNPAAPQQTGALGMKGEPTSVAITPNGRYALVCVRDSNYLAVIDLSTRSVVREMALGGQPDSIAISPNGVYAAIAIENERPNEALPLPSNPPGFVTIVDLGRRLGNPLFRNRFFGDLYGGFTYTPDRWSLRNVSLVGVPNRLPTDPEPEYVTINRFDRAGVTLQENNYIVDIDLATGRVVRGFSAGTTTHAADLKNNSSISFTDTLLNARLEPDAIAWTLQGQFVTANEGDYNLDLLPGQFTGGRNFTIFDWNGGLMFDSGASLEIAAAGQGLYPDNRSNNRGVEPEGATVAFYDGNQYGFIGAERGNFVAVYNLNNPGSPQLLQLLPTGSGSRPEGLLPVPNRRLFITANENNGTLSIFRLQ